MNATISYHTVNGKIRSTTARPTGNSCAENFRFTPYGKQIKTVTGFIPPYFGWVGSYGYRQTNLNHAEQYVRARHYSTTEARWTTRDPLWPEDSSYGYLGEMVLADSDHTGQGQSMWSRFTGFVEREIGHTGVITDMADLLQNLNGLCKPRSYYFTKVDKNGRPILPSNKSYLRNCCQAMNCMGLFEFKRLNQIHGGWDYKDCGPYDAAGNYNAGFTACCWGMSFQWLIQQTGHYKKGHSKVPYPKAYKYNKPSGYCEMLYGYMDCTRNKRAINAICNHYNCSQHSISGSPCLPDDRNQSSMSQCHEVFERGINASIAKIDQQGAALP